MASYDVIIVGAGISGINAAYRIQTELPELTYKIIEARGNMGGTWDLFKYPGIRSDSDLHTFGFPWRPWTDPKAIADGPSIVKYIKETAAIHGIDKKIEYHRKLLSANWSTEQQNWSLEVQANGEKTVRMNGRFLIFSTGYYSYDEPLDVEIPGIENFKGVKVHPQFWPEDLDYTNKKMVIIGSGATAITLLPNLTDKAEHVTMLQRSPGYTIALPGVDAMGEWAKRWLPSWIAYKLIRIKFLVLPWLFFQFCRAYPNAAKRALRRRTKNLIPSDVPLDPHFNPRYNPWEQRLCVAPDGDFYKCLHSGKASIATGVIEQVTEHGITLKSGQKLEADIIITATGLKLQVVGGAKLAVDGNPVKPGDKFLWKGIMLQDLPNAAFVLGYTNASWTLGADACARTVCRLLKNMRTSGAMSATPTLPEGETIKPANVLNLNSTYIVRAQGTLPKAGDKGNWKARSNYFRDLWEARFGDLKSGLNFYRVSS